MQKSIGLLFGSFNPIHRGHEKIAEYMTQFFDEVWFVVSPQNPFKELSGLAPFEKRLQWVDKIYKNHSKIKVSAVEGTLPTPSYTYQTLIHLKENNPNYKFSIIIGADNLPKFHKWIQYKNLIHENNIYVYNRNLNDTYFLIHQNIIYIHANLIDISSTYIREQINNIIVLEQLINSHIINDVCEFYKQQ